MNNLSLFTMAKIALKHIVFLVLAAVIAAVGAFSYCSFVATPKYSATGSVIVTNGAIITNSDDKSTLNNSDIVASINFAETVVDILNTNGIYKNLSEKLDGKYSYSQLKGCSRVARRGEDTLFIDVSFTTVDKDEAVKLVNEYLKLVPSYINEFVPDTAATATTRADAAGKIYPKTLTTTVLFAVLAAGIVYIIFLIIFLSNTVIVGEEDFKERFDVAVIGSIPDFATAKSSKYYKSKYYNSYNYYSKGGVNNGK